MLCFEAWLQKLGIQKLDRTLIKTALTHSSYKGMEKNVEDNERLEFLGDAVLDLINANLFYGDKTLTEADMTEKRKNFVSNNELAKLFNKLGMQNYIFTAKNLKLSNKIKADFVEALFGAVFDASGYQKCFKLWRTIQNIVKSETKASNKRPYKKTPAKKKTKLVLKNAKSTLMEFCQENSFSQPEYITINKQGPDHNPLFTVRVTVNSGGNSKKFRTLFKLKPNQKLRVFSDGKGKRIKNAEMKAAQKLCNIIGLHYSK
ncbi:MAG: ribonuclease III family protein [Promethearchaeota archaeon]